jgi:multidrug resistance efflux pump
MDDTQIAPIRSGLPRGYRVHPQMGILYDTAPGNSDDLTQIDGINTREAVALNQLGVYTFGQIAMWTQREVTAIADQLRISSALIADQQWVEQAQYCCQRTDEGGIQTVLPATLVRTVSFVACALLCGFLLVYFLAQGDQQPLQGVLSAEITTLHVPTASRLLATHVRPGDEVFSGEVLLTLEKLEHLETIEKQHARVRDLSEELQQAEARATLEIDLQTSDIDRQMLDLQTQIDLVLEQNAALKEAEQPVVDMAIPAHSVPAMTVSAAKSTVEHEVEPGGLLFFSGQSGQSSPFSKAADPPAAAPAEAEVATAAQPVSETAQMPVKQPLQSTTQLEVQLQRLENLKDLIPDRIRMAAGIEQMRLRLEEATSRLEQMQAASREIAVVSPAYGVVGQIRCHEGDLLQSGDVLLKILHSERRFVVVYVPTERVADLQTSDTVRLGFGERGEFRGTVVEIPTMASATTPGGPSLAAVRVEESGRMWPDLPIGSRVDVILR